MPPKRKATQEALGRGKRQKKSTTVASAQQQPIDFEPPIIDTEPVIERAEPVQPDHSAVVNAVLAALEQRGVIPKTLQANVPTNTNENDQLRSSVVADVQRQESSGNEQVHDSRRQIQDILPVESLYSYNLAPSALITDKVKQAIWTNEFIELGNLLKPSHQEEDIVVHFGQGHNISVRNKQEQKSLSIGQWLTAFTKFMDVYIQKFPHEASGLLAYISLIRDLERVHGQAAFNFYDRNFRAHRQSQLLPWGALHSELWIRATTVTGLSKTVSSGGSVQKRYCFDFNKPQGCTRKQCQYAHICSGCRKNHPKFKCWGKTSGSHAASTSTVSSSKTNQDRTQSFRANAESISVSANLERTASFTQQPCVGHLTTDAQRIIANAISPRTQTIYKHYWDQYVKFCTDKHIKLAIPVTEIRLVNYLAFLFGSGYRVSTIASHSSALAYINKLFGFSDFSNSFVVRQFFKGANNLSADSQQPDTRLPITIDLLSKIINALPTTIQNRIERIMFSTMCILAFNGFLRIGEICSKTQQTNCSILQKVDVNIIENEGVEIILRRYKHSSSMATLFMPANDKHPRICPVKAVQSFDSYFQHKAGPFFQFHSGNVASYSFFNSHLRNVIAFLGFSTQQYKSHSFRIGAATHAAMQGFHDDAIQKMGRWKSNAVKNYIRLPKLHL